MFIPDFATVRFDVREGNWFAGLKLADGRADRISECDIAGRKVLPGGQCGRVLGVIAKVDCVYMCCMVGQTAASWIAVSSAVLLEPLMAPSQRACCGSVTTGPAASAMRWDWRATKPQPAAVCAVALEAPVGPEPSV